MEILNKWERLFLEYLDDTEFALVKHEDGFGVTDYNGCNFGDIEAYRFETAAQLFERFDRYNADYYEQPLLDALENIGIKVGDGEDDLQYRDYADLAKKVRRILARPPYPYGEDGSTERHYIDMLSMIANHANEIDIGKVYNYLIAPTTAAVNGGMENTEQEI